MRLLNLWQSTELKSCIQLNHVKQMTPSVFFFKPRKNLKIIYLHERSITERERDSPSVHSPSGCAARAGSVQIGAKRLLSWVCHVGAGAQALGTSDYFPVALAYNWIGSGAARAQIGAHVEC